MNKFYPAYIHLEERDCLVIGGGKTAYRKVLSLLDCGAQVTVISPEVCAELVALADEERITLHKREYQKGDVDPKYRMVIGATNSPATNISIADEASSNNVLCNIVDQPLLCDFYVPATVQRGDLKIAISTSGKSPAMARKIREELEREYGDEYTRFLEDLGKLRHKLLTEFPDDEKRRRDILMGVVESPALELLKKNDIDGYQRELDKWNCCS